MILEKLRAETAPEHREVEASLGLPGQVDSLESYRRLLKALYGFHRVYEPILEAALGGGLPDLISRRKIAWLERDLLAFGVTRAELEAIPRAEAADLPRIENAAAALGSFYVLEGSTLGGQLISRDLASRLDLSADHGLAFYRGYGAETGRRWKEFCVALKSLDSVYENELDLITDGARDTFRKYGAWLVRHWRNA